MIAWPQTIVTADLVVSVVLHAALHGRDRTRFNRFFATANALIVVLVLFKGGFFAVWGFVP